MANYKEIHGVQVQYRDSDAPEIEGDVWYNASTGKLKMYASLGSWASGDNINTARIENGGCGTSTATLTFGGKVPAPSTTGITESYNGSTWTETGDLNTARGESGDNIGTQTAALAVGGGPTGGAYEDVESFNGTSWTEITDINTGRWAMGGSGTTTAAIVFGGGAPGGHQVVAEQFD